jgi:phosphodiesterase/alkaline phosphatase D-like protein
VPKPRILLIAALLAVTALAATTTSSAVAATCTSAPQVKTSAATGVTATDATLNGTVNAEGCPTTYEFEYGGSDAYGAMTAATSAGTGTSAVAETATVTGLSPHTIYQFRLMATNAAGVAIGANESFTTGVACVPGGQPAPAVTTSAATPAASGVATSHGKVDPNGCATTYTFQYGTTGAYGSVTSTASAGNGTAAVAAQATLTHLAPSTVYHVRLVATSAAGTTDGADTTFTTKADCVKGGTAAPPVSTGSAVSVSDTGATLTGTVDPLGCTTTYTFAYGSTTTAQTKAASAGSGLSARTVTTPIAGLAPNTLYHYRIRATSATGTSTGAERSFRTAPLPRPGVVRIGRQTGSVTRRYIAHVRVSCTAGIGTCTGTVSLYRTHRLVGTATYAVPAGGSRVFAVRLNPRGRALMRAHRRRLIEVLARGGGRHSRRYVTFVRRFPA